MPIIAAMRLVFSVDLIVRSLPKNQCVIALRANYLLTH